MSCVIDWSQFDEAFGGLYAEGQGRPVKRTRLLVGLNYLKHAEGLSDEAVVAQCAPGRDTKAKEECHGFRTLIGSVSVNYRLNSILDQEKLLVSKRPKNTLLTFVLAS